VHVVDLQQVDGVRAEATKRFRDDLRRVRQLTLDRRLGGEEYAVA